MAGKINPKLDFVIRCLNPNVVAAALCFSSAAAIIGILTWSTLSGAALTDRFVEAELYTTYGRGSIDAILGAIVLALSSTGVILLKTPRKSTSPSCEEALLRELLTNTRANLEALEANHRKARATILSLQHRLTTIQEEERRQISRELHDSTLNHLAAVGLNLMHLSRIVSPSSEVSNILRQTKSSLQMAAKELRIFTYLMHPPALESDGLRAAAARFAAGFSQRTGIKVRLRLAGQIDDSHFQLQCCIFRILQETLSNVHRHAKASEVQIFLARQKGHITLMVNDNGRGFAVKPDTSESRLGVGIPGMRMRLRTFGGWLQIKRSGSVTSIRAYVPLTRPVLIPSLTQRAA